MNWEPIETAPKDGTEVLVACGNSVTVSHYYNTERFEHGKSVFRREGWHQPWLGPFAEFKPTHWMPIPAPPPALSEAA